jgi:hypothetical protein
LPTLFHTWFLLNSRKRFFGSALKRHFAESWTFAILMSIFFFIFCYGLPISCKATQIIEAYSSHEENIRHGEKPFPSPLSICREALDCIQRETIDSEVQLSTKTAINVFQIIQKRNNHRNRENARKGEGRGGSLLQFLEYIFY